ncbi:YARHG domain-containing protein [Methylobacterium thuringiense]|uniref:YARHG domain-containing protein n=1 Tax=Methylobacterium thuringiense TaxID=1003091 RepID=A0ABQ4TRX7_9HYPH|nr:hypothetical protein EKPJFOCH_3118 [Methylobacterium thuringiense]
MLRLAFACLASCITLSPALAGFPCDELRAERNSTYKDAGYCFKTAQAIREYGNADCRYDDIADVPLSAAARKKIAEIVADERRNGCAR